MIWTFVAGALVFILHQYNVIYSRTGAGHRPGLVLLDGLALFVAPIALAVWLGFALGWYALLLLAAFLIPVGARTDPMVLLSFRWPMGLALVCGVAALWAFGWPPS